MYRLPGIFTVLVILCLTATTHATDDFGIRTDPATKERYFIFESAKGNVRFNHERHQDRMKAESCLPCHKTKTPTREHTMSRFNKQIAHSFCKRCHKENGRGPTECHECHNGKK